MRVAGQKQSDPLYSRCAALRYQHERLLLTCSHRIL